MRAADNMYRLIQIGAEQAETLCDNKNETDCLGNSVCKFEDGACSAVATYDPCAFQSQALCLEKSSVCTYNSTTEQCLYSGSDADVKALGEYWGPWTSKKSPRNGNEDESRALWGTEWMPCLNPIAIECRPKNPASTAPQKASCEVATGFKCLRADNNVDCPDFEVRYQCSQTEGYWGSWTSLDNNGGKDIERRLTYNEQGKMPCYAPIAIECRDKGTGLSSADSDDKFINGFACQLGNGLECATNDCLDYEVRYACAKDDENIERQWFTALLAGLLATTALSGGAFAYYKREQRKKSIKTVSLRIGDQKEKIELYADEHFTVSPIHQQNVLRM